VAVLTMRDDRERAVFVISVAAELAGMHPQTLRMYERRGLLRPQRSAKNARRYSPADVERLRRIQELGQSGLNLAGVQRVLAMEEQMAVMERELQVLRARLAEAAAELERETRRIDVTPPVGLVPVRPAAVVPLGRRRRRW
jgi:MerR family transcriptional regulator, heat shock protein HspR